MALRVGEIVAEFDVETGDGLDRAERLVEGFTRSADGRIRDLRGRFASESQAIARELGDGFEHGAERAGSALDGFWRDANGRWRDQRGRFVTAGELAALGLSNGLQRGTDRGLSRWIDGMLGRLRRLGSVVGPALGSVAVSAAGIGTALGAALPAAAGLAAALANVAPAAGLGATAVFALGQAVASIKLGTSGIGDALKAAFAGGGGGGGGGGGAAKAAAAARQAIADATEQAARANERAIRAVADAERNLADAQKDALRAQNDLNEARGQASEDLEDLNNRLADAELDQRDAVLDVARAQERLDEVRKEGAKSTERDVAEAELGYERAVQRLKEQTTTTGRLRAETAAANRAGVEGSRLVTDAQERLAEAQRTVGDRTRDVQDAQTEQARTAREGLEQIKRAQDALNDSVSSGAGGVDKFAEAMAKLSPAARAFVQEVIRLKLAWDSLKLDVQERLFQGLAGELRSTATAVMPTLRANLVGTAGAFNDMAKGVGLAARELAASGTLGAAMGSATKGLENLRRIPGQIVDGLGKVAAAAGPSFDRLTDRAGGAVDRLAGRLAGAFASGGMQRAIERAISLIGDLVDVARNVGDIFGSVFDAVQLGGGGSVSVLKDITAQMAAAFASPQIQLGLRALSETVGVLGRTAGPLLAEALKGIGRSLDIIAPSVQLLIEKLGEALMPIVEALGRDVLPVVSDAFAKVVAEVAPLLPQLGQLVADILTKLTPVLAELARVMTTELAKQVRDIAIPALQLLAGILNGDARQAVEGFKGLFVGLAKTVVRELFMLPGEIGKAVGPLGIELFKFGEQLIWELLRGIGQAIDRADDWMWDAGANLLDSLIDGVMSKVPDFKGSLQWLTGMIPEWKGPRERDRVLLRPAGRMLMDGLMGGISDRVPDLRGQLGGLTAEIGGMQFAGAAGGGGFGSPFGGPGGAALHVENYYEAPTGSARSTAEELAWMAKGRG
ncbi:phage tail protein [Kitasatospora sp. NPDC004289]